MKPKQIIKMTIDIMITVVLLFISYYAVVFFVKLRKSIKSNT